MSESWSPWKRSSASTINTCVEVSVGPGGQRLVRSSNRKELTPLPFTSQEWDAFLKGVKAGEFDLDG